MSSQLDPGFSKLRSLIWPIHRHELKKLVPMWLIMFLVCFSYSVLRCLKDSLVLTSSGAEVIPFIKVWVMLPAAFLLTFIFTRLTNLFSQEKVFYIVISGFLTFFALFAFIIYPMGEALHLDGLAKTLEGILPAGFRGLINMVRYWTLTLFYVMAELWGIALISVLFWGFANEVTKVNEASRFYGVVGVGSNISSIAAGLVTIALAPGKVFYSGLPFGSTAWEQTLMLLVLLVIASGIAAMAIFRWMNQNVLNDPCYEAFHRSSFSAKKKKKLSVLESFSYLAKSKYLQCIAVLVLSYNLVINIVEVLWKDQMRQLYPNPADLLSYTSYLVALVGVISTIASFFMSPILNRLGWTRTALLTPLIMLVTSMGFFVSLFLKGQGDALLLGVSPLAMAVFFGAAQNVMSKASKHSVFDTTKEMSFIPLSHECKLKGKAAIDGVGSRLGKSGGSLIHQGLLMIFVTFSQSAPIVALIVMAVIVIWSATVRNLGNRFEALVKEGSEVSFENELEPVT